VESDAPSSFAPAVGISSSTIDRPTKRFKESNDTINANEGGVAAATSKVSSAESSSVSSPNDEHHEKSKDDDGNKNNNNGVAMSCLKLLFAPLPSTLTTATKSNANNEDEKVLSFRNMWTKHGFRTSVVTSPRPAVSVYLDSCREGGDVAPSTTASTSGASATGIGTATIESEYEAGRAYLLTCIGMHPSQMIFEEGSYQSTLKDVFCLYLFLKRMKYVRRGDMEDERLTKIVSPWEEKLQALLKEFLHIGNGGSEEQIMNLQTTLQELRSSASPILSKLLSTLIDIDHSLRRDQLLHEYNRIVYENCTLANACLQRWLAIDYDNKDNEEQLYDLDQVYFKPSPRGRYLPKYERITMHFKDPDAVEPTKGKLIWMPGLTEVLTASSSVAASGKSSATHPLVSIADNMLTSTWSCLLRNGYYVDEARKSSLGPELRKFYISGLVSGSVDGNLPILLNAHFTPTHPLSLYLHGTAGAGKSSLVRALTPAIHSSISRHADPELLVRFVKQNLNKPMATLTLELELRPNNNDYSVMSIIQGRRMTLTQSKPGLVLVALEEMPSDVVGVDPRQEGVGRLVSMRFSGRKGEFVEEEGQEGGGSNGGGGGTSGVGKKRKEAPRNSTKRGISGDATIITIFTSNYNLEAPCRNALQRLDMFKNLHVVQVAPVAGKDRKAFALSYLTQQVEDSLKDTVWNTNVTGRKKVTIQQLDIPCGEGDIRPLVRYLRLLSFYIHAMMVKDAAASTVSVSFDASTNITTVTAKRNPCNGEFSSSLQLKPGSFQNLYAITPPMLLDPRASQTLAELQKLHPDKLENPSELSQILDFYFAKTLAPAVILSHDKQLIGDLVEILSKMEGVHGINGINPAGYKMMKSLYDAADTPNLRDDIIEILHENQGGGYAGASSTTTTFIAVELVCHTTDSQLQIREIIEDTPSMTAFSTERSALHKDGLLFAVYVEGEITPEIRSRASLVI